MKKYAITLLLVVMLVTIISPSAKALAADEVLIVNQPKDKFVTNNPKIVVSGETMPQTNINVLVNGSSKAKLPVGAAGIFLTQVPAATRENMITVKAAFPTGKNDTVSRMVYYIDTGSKQPELDSLIQSVKNFLILK